MIALLGGSSHIHFVNYDSLVVLVVARTTSILSIVVLSFSLLSLLFQLFLSVFSSWSLSSPFSRPTLGHLGAMLWLCRALLGPCWVYVRPS